MSNKDMSTNLFDRLRQEEDFLKHPQIQSAKFFCLNLYNEFNEFEESLEEGYCLSLRVEGSGDILSSYSGISWREPNIVIFHGETKSGAPARIVQHLSKASVTFVVVSDVERRRGLFKLIHGNKELPLVIKEEGENDS